jgi:transforming growth factor-beta-induced protein
LISLADQGDLKSAWRWRKAPTFFNLTYALAKTRLLSTVIINDLTVFAPTDDAFRKLFKELGVRNIRQLSAAQLKPILLYHVVEGRVRSTDLTNGFVPTLNGAAVKIDLTDGVKVNEANVIFTDLRALNGIIHGIDEVLLPPTKNLVEVAQSIPDFSILVDAVVAAGLAETLATGGPFTVFAPTNNAFVNLLGELGFADLNALVDALGISGLQSVLLYHVVDGRVYSSDLPLGPLSVSTKNTQSFTIDVTIPGITDANGRESGLVPSRLDVQATNGVIHVIDTVILPVL